MEIRDLVFKELFLSLKVHDLCLLLDVLAGDPFDEVELSVVFREELFAVQAAVDAIAQQHLDPLFLFLIDVVDRSVLSHQLHWRSVRRRSERCTRSHSFSPISDGFLHILIQRGRSCFCLFLFLFFLFFKLGFFFFLVQVFERDIFRFRAFKRVFRKVWRAGGVVRGGCVRLEGRREGESWKRKRNFW